MNASIRGQLFDRKINHGKLAYHWWKKPIKQILFFVQDWQDSVKLFSDNHKEKYEPPKVLERFLFFYIQKFIFWGVNFARV